MASFRAFRSTSFFGAADESDPERFLLSSDESAAASDAAAAPPAGAGAGGVSAPSWMAGGWGSAILGVREQVVRWWAGGFDGCLVGLFGNYGTEM